jgi:hypothetical protein
MVSATVAVFCVGLVFMAIFVVDGGRMLSRYVEAHDVAAAAARAAAQAIDEDALYAGEQPRVASTSAAMAAATDVVPSTATVTGVSIDPTDAARVTVTVQMTQDLLLAPPGVSPTATFTASATATAQRGVEGAA